jgi:3-hydroxybutyryl-CoA dehydrogenase
MNMRTVGVIGAGVMGEGVAQSLAQAGLQVVLVDIADAALDRARRNIERSVAVAGLFSKGPKVAAPELLARIRCTMDYAELKACDGVIENVPEQWSVKQGVYAKLEAACPEACIFAANTSAIPITTIASATRRPAKVIGMHFMNPVPAKPMVEVIRGFHTSEETLATARALLKDMGKECVVVNDSPGFVTNRVLMLTINEAAFLVQENVASVADIDKLFKSCFGHKMGPLETADLIGLDTILYSIEVLHASFNDSKYRPCPLLRKMVDANLHGRKNGRGFYSYQV